MTRWNSGALCSGFHLHVSCPCLHRRVSVCFLRCSILAKNVDFWRWKMETWKGREWLSRHPRDDGTANRQNASLRPDKRGLMRSRRPLGAGAECHKSTFLAKNGGRRLKRTARGGEKRGGTGVRAPAKGGTGVRAPVGAGRRPRGSEGQCARTRGDVGAKRRVRGSEGNNGQARGAPRLARMTRNARRRRGQSVVWPETVAKRLYASYAKWASSISSSVSRKNRHAHHCAAGRFWSR